VAARGRGGSVRPGARGRGGGGVAPAQVAEMQRARLVAAAVAVVDERGYREATVAQITGRSRVSRRTFYEVFANVEACLAAAVEDVLGALEAELRGGPPLDGLAWAERVRAGLWRILCFFDREPVLARVLVVHSQRGGPAVAAARERALARLTASVDAGRRECSGAGAGAAVGELTALSAEGVVGAGVAIVQARLARRQRPALSGLLGELTAIVVLPYLGVEAARRERTRPAPPAPPRPRRSRTKTPAGGDPDPLAGLPMRLTYRTARVLDAVGEHPGASNRQVSDYAEIADQGQVSKLLARLERLGLLENAGGGHLQGEPNAWRLTRLGELVGQRIAAPIHRNGSSGRHTRSRHARETRQR
jgi:AcrR family transcriptional regulator